MKIRTINRYFAEAMKSIIRNRMMSLTSVVIVSACLLIIIFMYSITANINSMMRSFAANMLIAIFIEDEVTAEDLNDLFLDILHHPDVSNVVFMPPDENMQAWIERGLNPELFDRLTADLFRRRMDITVVDIDYVSSVVAWLASPEMQLRGVDAISSGSEDIVEQLVSINRTVNVVISAIIAVLAVLSVVIITNTIRITIAGRKNEIGIMKFIGATNWFIRWPFVLEGMILGVAGASISLILVITFYDRIIQAIISTLLMNIAGVSFLAGIELFPAMVPLALLAGGLLGTFSSIVTIRRYLDV